MSQNINLFNPIFRKQRQVLTLATVAYCLCITLAALLGYNYYQREQVAGLGAELQTAQALLKSQQRYVEQLKGRTAPKADALIEADIARLERELKTAREAMGALKGGAFGNQQGFAEYLRAFSRQSVNGLWLTGFTIAGSGDLEIHGRVLTPDLVPNYIQRLNKEQVLAGHSFARLEMSRPALEADTEKAATTTEKAAKKTARPLRFLEFSLATTYTAQGEKTP